MNPMNRRGTEKPIEIFVALFVILAVALVMLKLFQGQITEKQAQLAQFQQDQKVKEVQDAVVLHCKSLCTDASNNGCSQQSLAALCLGGADEVLKAQGVTYLALDQNNVMDFNAKSFGGVGVCEDKVYCFNGFVDQCCNQKITPASCFAILRDFWKGQGYDAATQNGLICSYLNRGACTPTGAEAKTAWWNTVNYPVCPNIAS
jgi:hypothetical protein